MVRTMLQSTKTFDTKLVRYIEWSNVQPWVHHISPIWPHYGHFGPKNSHIWPYLAIGSPSCPKLVEHWLNMVEHRSPHLGWATWTPLHPPKWPRWAWEGPQNGHFLPYSALFGQNRPYLHLFGWTFWTYQKWPRGGWEGPHISHFLARFGHIWPETDRIYIYGRCCTSCIFLIFRVILFKACNFSLEED